MTETNEANTQPTAVNLTVGRIVHYRLSADDAARINRRRTDGASIAERMKGTRPAWPEGAQAHIGNPVQAGDIFPMLITKSSASWCNGQVFLDGNDVLWVTSVAKGDTDGTWFWPPRA